MDKIEVAQADTDAWEIYGPKIFHCEMTGPEALAAHRATRTDATPVATDVAALVEQIVRDVCELDGDTADDDPNRLVCTVEELEVIISAALAPFTKGQNDDAVR